MPLWTVKSELTPLNTGNRNFDAVMKVAVIHPSDEEGDFSTEIPPQKWLTWEDNLALGGGDEISGQKGVKHTTSVTDDIHDISVRIRDAQLAEREATLYETVQLRGQAAPIGRSFVSDKQDRLIV